MLDLNPHVLPRAHHAGAPSSSSQSGASATTSGASSTHLPSGALQSLQSSLSSAPPPSSSSSFSSKGGSQVMQSMDWSKIKDLKSAPPEACGDKPRIYMSSKTSRVVVVFPNGEMVEGE